MCVSLKFILFHIVLDGFQQLTAAWYRRMLHDTSFCSPEYFPVGICSQIRAGRQPLRALLYDSHICLACKNFCFCTVLMQSCIALTHYMKSSFNSLVYLQTENNIMIETTKLSWKIQEKRAVS